MHHEHSDIMIIRCQGEPHIVAFILHLLLTQYCQLLKDPLLFYSVASGLQRPRTVLFLLVANTKLLELELYRVVHV